MQTQKLQERNKHGLSSHQDFSYFTYSLSLLDDTCLLFCNVLLFHKINFSNVNASVFFCYYLGFFLCSLDKEKIKYILLPTDIFFNAYFCLFLTLYHLTCLPACRRVFHMHTCFPWRPRDDIRSSRNWCTDNSGQSYECCQQNPGSRKTCLIVTEPTLHLQHLLLHRRDFS